MPIYAPVPEAQRLTLVKVLEHATHLNQLIFALLIGSALVSAAIWAVQATRPAPSRAGAGLAFLSGVLVVSPLLALAAAAYQLTHMSLGVANLRPTPDVATLAPGFAEMSLLVFLGLAAAGVAAAGRVHLSLRSGGASGPAAA